MRTTQSASWRIRLGFGKEISGSLQNKAYNEETFDTTSAMVAVGNIPEPHFAWTIKCGEGEEKSFAGKDLFWFP